MKNLLRPTGFRILIVLLLLAVFVIAVLKYLTPTEISGPTPPKPAISPPSFPAIERRNIENYQAAGGYAYSGPAINFPAKLPVLIPDGERLTLEEARSIAGRLGIPNPPEKIKDIFDKTSYFFKSETAVLSFQETDQVLDYQINDGLPSHSAAVSFEKLKGSIASFLRKAGPSSQDYAADEKSLKYYSADDEGGVISNPLKTNYIEVGYFLKEGGLPLITSYPKDLLFFALEPDGKVRHMRYQIIPKRKPGGEYRLKTLNEAVAELNQNKGEIVKIELQGEQNPDFSQKSFISADLSEVSPAYYYKPGETVIYPIFIFKGSGLFPNGQKANLVIYLPAVK